MPSFDTLLTTGEVHFLVESLFPTHPGKFKATFEPGGSYAVRARIEVPDDKHAAVLQQAIARMRNDRLTLDRIARLRPPAAGSMPRDELTD